MISLTDIHESRSGEADATVTGARVLAVGTGERNSLGRVVAEAIGEGRCVLIRCCRGALRVGDERVGVGMCLVWDEGNPARVEEAPMQAVAVVAEGVANASARPVVYGRGDECARAFDDVVVAWLSGEGPALERGVQKLLRCVEGRDYDARQRSRIAHGARVAMDNHVGDPLTIPELADSCGTSPTVLKESFRDEFGLPVYEWYRRLRMLRASELLCEGVLAVGEVAARVGYSNASKFARAFSDCMGASPSEFRRA